jgi:hypothetical protein
MSPARTPPPARRAYFAGRVTPLQPSPQVPGSSGTVPGAPTAVTSITKDSGATVSFLAPSSAGTGGTITSYTVTPYISGTAQAPTTISTGSLGAITGSNGNSYLQAAIAGLANGTAYTFSVHASNGAGAGPESAQSGANTPLSGLVFGDDFNGPANGAIDPEWWVYTRCGYLAQSETEYYLPSQVALDGNSNLLLTAVYQSYTGPSYPSAGGGNVTQPWRSGSVQSNTRTYAPSVSTNTMTFETRMQVPADSGNQYWPSFWLSGNAYLTQWKTDPQQGGPNTTTQSEIDVNEWPSGEQITTYGANCYTDSSSPNTANPNVGNLSAAMHVYQARWKPSTRAVAFYCDGTVQVSLSNAPVQGAQMFLMQYLQMTGTGSLPSQSVVIDYVRVYDQNLG